MFDIVCHKSAVWLWNLFDAHALQSITTQLWRLFCCQGLPHAGCALQSGRRVHMTSVRCWVWPTTPAGPGFRRLNYFEYKLYGSHDTVSQHARKASTPRGAQFDSFSRPSQGPPPKHELHEWSQSSPHSHLWRVPGASRNRLASVKKANFVAGEYGGATLRIYGAAVGPRGHTLRV